MRRTITAFILCTALGMTMLPANARAEGYVNPWAGINFGNDLNDGRAGFGVSAGAMGAGIIGGEFTFGYNPSFFGKDTDFGSNTVLDVMGNLIVGIPFGGQRGGGFRPYVTGGLGLIRTQIDGSTLFDIEVSDNDFGWNLGAGAMAYFNDHVGIRGDLRYMRTFGDSSWDSLDFDGQFHYWRASFGVVFR